MKKRIFALVIALVAALTLAPTAFAHGLSNIMPTTHNVWSTDGTDSLKSVQRSVFDDTDPLVDNSDYYSYVASGSYNNSFTLGTDSAFVHMSIIDPVSGEELLNTATTNVRSTDTTGVLYTNWYKWTSTRMQAGKEYRIRIYTTNKAAMDPTNSNSGYYFLCVGQPPRAQASAPTVTGTSLTVTSTTAYSGISTITVPNANIPATARVKFVTVNRASGSTPSSPYYTDRNFRKSPSTTWLSDTILNSSAYYYYQCGANSPLVTPAGTWEFRFKANSLSSGRVTLSPTVSVTYMYERGGAGFTD